MLCGYREMEAGGHLSLGQGCVQDLGGGFSHLGPGLCD